MIDFEARMKRLRLAMAEWGADCLFLNPGPDFHYYTGIPVPEY